MIIKAPIDLELTQNSGQTSQPPWKLDNNIYSDVVVADNKAVLFQVKQKENNLDFNFIGDISNKEATKKIKTIFDLDFNLNKFYMINKNILYICVCESVSASVYRFSFSHHCPKYTN